MPQGKVGTYDLFHNWETIYISPQETNFKREWGNTETALFYFFQKKKWKEKAIIISFPYLLWFLVTTTPTCSTDEKNSYI
jgi:hypothetical protein